MEPISALGLASSVVGIADFGLQIATALQTYTEAALEADDRMRDIAFDISNAASALRLLQDVITEDEKTPETTVFSAEGLKAIQAIVLRCDARLQAHRRPAEQGGAARRAALELPAHAGSEDLGSRSSEVTVARAQDRALRQGAGAHLCEAAGDAADCESRAVVEDVRDPP